MDAIPQYDELQLRMEPRGGGGYDVVAFAPDGGKATGPFENPISELELDNLILQVARPAVGRGSPARLEQPRELGRVLFQHLMGDAVGQLYRHAMRTADSNGRGLRILLAMGEAPELLDLPWELLYDPEGALFLSQSIYTPIVRSLDLKRRRAPPSATLPLQILGLVSAPQGFAQLDVAAERAKLEQALGPLITSGAVRLQWLETATLAELERRIAAPDEVHVIHYVGHGTYGDRTNGGILVLETERGGPHEVTGEELGAVVRDVRSLRLAVLNPCEGARSSHVTPFSGVASSLIRSGGLPAVIGMQTEMSDTATITFSDRFYFGLTQGLPMDVALAQARRAIFAGGGRLEFAAPVLLLPGSEVLPDAALRPSDLGTEEPREPTEPEVDEEPRLREKVEWVSDSPASEDALGRLELARALSRRLQRIRRHDPGTSFLVHVDGPWGSGKSTLLQFVGKELKAQGWLVVNFDAWRQSRVGPPWWSLLTSLRAALGRSLPAYRRPGLWLGETVERLRRSGAPYMLALVALVLVAVGLYFLFRPSDPDTGSAGDVVRSVSAVLAVIGTLWGGAVLASKFLLWNSPAGARAYERYHEDPMENLADHFGWLIAQTGRPVVFFIDDLDRCDRDYVVDLLDSVQTIVRDAPRRRGRPGADAPYFVVAADGAWVRKSYEDAYAGFSEAVSEPGRSLGYLFLNKVFQLTLRVPVLSPRQQTDYLEGLLLDESAHSTEPAPPAARQRLEASSSETEVMEALNAESPQVRAQLAPLAIQRLSDEEVQQTTEHALKRFAPLLEPNPRAMKRFVNEYGMARAAGILEDTLVERDTLALWTLLTIRWPALAEYLEARPEAADGLLDGTMPSDDCPEALKLLIESGLPSTVMSFPHGGPLSHEMVERCIGRRSGEDTSAQA